MTITAVGDQVRLDDTVTAANDLTIITGTDDAAGLFFTDAGINETLKARNRAPSTRCSQYSQ